eukprot:g23013.t1
MWVKESRSIWDEGTVRPEGRILWSLEEHSHKNNENPPSKLSGPRLILDDHCLDISNGQLIIIYQFKNDCSVGEIGRLFILV